jgi:hypothetical protein
MPALPGHRERLSQIKYPAFLVFYSTNEQTPATRTLLRRAAVLFLATRLFVFAVAYGWLLLSPARETLPPNHLIWHGDTGGHGLAAEPWRRWDALWFLKTARDGYSFSSEAQSNVTVFPLYPILISGFSGLGLDPILAGMLISNISLFFAIFFILSLIWERAGEQTAVRATAALLLFPSAFVLSGVYSESLFLCAAAGAMYFARRRDWAQAALCGFMAAFTRFAGIILIIPLLIELFDSLGRGLPAAPVQGAAGAGGNTQARGLGLPGIAEPQLGTHKSRAHGLWLLLIPLAPLLFFLYLQQRTGSFFAYFMAQAHWQKNLAWPWIGLGWEITTSPWRLDTYLNVGGVLLFSALGVSVWRRFGAFWGSYVILGILMPVCASRWIGMPRYLLVLFPAFAALACAFRRRWAFLAWIAASMFLLAVCFREFAEWKISF